MSESIIIDIDNFDKIGREVERQKAKLEEFLKYLVKWIEKNIPPDKWQSLPLGCKLYISRRFIIEKIEERKVYGKASKMTPITREIYPDVNLSIFIQLIKGGLLEQLIAMTKKETGRMRRASAKLERLFG